jgi:D-alanyl-D-alanine carboxypeptidase
MKSQSVTVYDATSKKYLYQKLSTNRMNPASITKILTVYTFLQKIKNVNAKATLLASEVSQPKSTGAVVTGLSPTESITYNDLLHGALLVSGADAVLALTRQTYGSTTALAEAMNANARKFGMYNSHFTNGIGLTDASHYTTGVDITKLLNNVLKDSKFTKIFHSKKYTTSDGKHTFYSPSRSYGSNVLGAKNGLTNAAAECVALEAKVNNHTVYITTMHASTPAERKADVKTILNYLKFKIQ